MELKCWSVGSTIMIRQIQQQTHSSTKTF